MSAKQKDPLAWYIPPEAVLWLGPFALAFVCGLATTLMNTFFAVRRGDLSFLVVSFGVCLTGVLLLFFARLPLYRQRRWFTFGPRHLTGIHRRIYFVAYGFLVIGFTMILALIRFL